LIGLSLHARTPPTRKTEVACKVVNIMTGLGMLVSRQIAYFRRERAKSQRTLTFGTKVSDKDNPAYAGRAGGGIPSGPVLAPSGAKPIHGAGGDALSRRHAQRFAARSASLRRLAPL
jgi:hypothetical protein